jgi:hypothetical protein
MLSQKIINKILEIGFYFDDEFDFEKNKIVLTQESGFLCVVCLISNIGPLPFCCE